MTRLDNIRAKILTKETLRQWVNIWRFKAQRIVFTNGCFDLLHRGHLEYLSKAADLGDVLIVGLNSDQSVRRIKGAGRPVNDQESRALALASQSCVTAVVIFEENTPIKLIEIIMPDVLVKGGDYEKDEIEGHDIVEINGGIATTVELVPDFSTTSLIRKIRTIDGNR